MTILFLIVLCCLVLSGCQSALLKHEPLKKDLTKSDLQTLTKPILEERTKKETQNDDFAIPKELLQKVSLSIDKETSVRSVLIEIARQAKIDLRFDPDVDGHVIFSAYERPFFEVVKSLCDVLKARCSFVEKTISIEKDSPYIKNYNVQFLNISRTSDNRITSTTDIFSSVQTGKITNDNGSMSSVTVSGNNDFWGELEANLKILLEKMGDEEQQSRYSIHRQAGIITIIGTSKCHKRIVEYLNQLKRASSSQVLIEAKIVEVVLKDEYRSGINWQKIGTKSDWYISAPFGGLASKSSFLDPSSTQSDMISFGAKGQTFSGILELIELFGSSRILSSPRLTVMNNQSALLKIAQNQVYFRIHYDKQYNAGTNRENVNISSDIQTVPIGLVMFVQPSIDPDTGDIVLFLRPTISRLSQSVRDPAVDIAYRASVQQGGDTLAPSLIPIVEVREIDSILRLKHEEIAVLGGLMEVRSIEDTTKIPVLGDIPIFQDFFRSKTKKDQIVELVILLKARIIDNTSFDQVDKRLLNEYIPDPRPFF
ncbi:MAG: type II secretion system protein GspD [Alphaproteobacteria bacterium]